MKTMIISIFIYGFIKLYLILNIYQQAHYQFKLYFKHFLLNLIFYDLFPFIIIILSMFNNSNIIIIICSIYLFIYSLFYLISRIKLKFTKRVIRIILLSILYLNIIFIPYIGLFLIIFLEFSIIPMFVLERILSKLINKKFIKKSKTILNIYHGNIIGITGSFGKTSTKKLLDQALNIFTTTSATPKSYNTELGIAKFINNISDINLYDNLILEFGASHKKDILKLKKIYKPNICFITGIGYMHIDTFGNINNVIKEKMSIISGCKIAVLNYECPFIREYEIIDNCHIISYGFNFGDYQAKNIINSEFDLYYKDTLLNRFKTNFVGNNQILNITGIIAYLYEQGYDLEKIKKAIMSFDLENNRLEIKKMNDFTIIDDSFNSNYDGFIEALNVLKNHNNKRILLTPGMVELGKYKKELYSNLINYIVTCSDIIILIGFYQTNIIYQKLRDYNKEVYLVRNFMEGYHLFLNISKIYKNSMLLIENDVPDLYKVGLI